MAELPAPEAPVSAATPAVPAPPSENNQVGAGVALAPKRQRRPSVRLGDIGDQPAASLSSDPPVRKTKPWRFPKDPALTSPKPSKSRPLTNLVNGGAAADSHETLDADERNNFDISGNLDSPSNRKPKAKRAPKRVRSNWAPRVDGGGSTAEPRDDRLNGGQEGGGGGGLGFRDFEPEGSETPPEDPSPVHSVDGAAGLGLWRGGHRRSFRARVSGSRLERGFCGEKGRDWFLDEGVRAWLMELGLSRYAPVFEIHEVDDEILPMLTLEDLKDMGISAVGSRRKMYASIQRLRQALS